MRLFIVLTLIVAIAILILQNGTLTVPLVLFGYSTPALPVSLWLLGGLGGGMLTFWILQLLNWFTVRRPEPPAPQTPPPPPRYQTSRRPPQERKTRIQDRSDWETPPSDDWETSPEDEDDWDIESPPGESTIPRRSFDDFERPPQPSYEVQRPPVNTSRQGSVYRQSYRGEKTQIQEDKPKGSKSVYDANYRVITPPYRIEENAPKNPQKNENRSETRAGEDWEF